MAVELEHTEQEECCIWIDGQGYFDFWANFKREVPNEMD